MLAFILNFPFTALGLLLGLLSKPVGLHFSKKPLAVIIKARSFWWALGYLKGARAINVGNCVLLGPKEQPLDLEHELVHVLQYERLPLIYPFLYYSELLRHGYEKNKYEVEAYRRAGNKYEKEI